MQQQSLDFRFPDGDDWDQFLSRLQQANFRSAVVGPHGSGKTTLLTQLQYRLSSLGHEVSMLRLNTETRSEAKPMIRQWLCDLPSSTILMLDGAEQLSWWRWHLFCLRVQNFAGLIITTHRPGRLPTALKTATSDELFTELVHELDEAHEYDPQVLHALLSRHDGNIRDCLRTLYDRKMNSRD